MKKKITQSDDIPIEEKFKSKTDHQHIFDLPDTYIGGIQEDDHKMWVYEREKEKLVQETVKYIPGLYKIIDEILVNSRDQTIKDKTCNKIKVNINDQTGEITCWNNGKNGIPVEFHKVEKCYVPEMLFSKIRTSEHYDTKEKIVGGKNGIGAKATNIYSKSFKIEIVDAKNMLKYNQEFKDNMFVKNEPQITQLKGKHEGYIEIKFIPDYKKFGVDKLTDDMIKLIKKRVYDIAAVTNAEVYLNEKLLKINGFYDYMKMFYEQEKQTDEFIYEEINKRWKIGIIFDKNSGFRQISYVNGICTYQGGTHVNYIMDQIVNKITEKILKKHKKLKIKSNIIKENITIFIDSTIEDPAFSSQTKEYLTTKVNDYGSQCIISEDFITKLCKTGIMEEVINYAKFKEFDNLGKLNGKKKSNLKGIDKLINAKWAGTRKSKLCRLLLTEGDSAKSFAVAGTDVIGRDYNGVFPLKGKLLNVREATAEQLKNNEEIINIMKIMGLKYKKTYTDVSELNYGGLIILTDQDVDGSHIKGLLINFIHYFWPSLLKIEGFIQTMATHIVKVWKKTDSKKKDVITFYTLSEFKNWKENLGEESKKWHIKYYKGLGTSTPDEAKECFDNFDDKIITYIWNFDNEKQMDDVDDENIQDEEINNQTEEFMDENTDAITLAFEKKRAKHRKEWLNNYDRNVFLDMKNKKISFKDFINKELIHFSNYDNIRSIPAIDGFKPSLRKILYSCFKKGIFKTEIKVAQLGGYVSDITCYHHGEASLYEAIIGMAQNFVGSNNINLLIPSGNFGDRMMGGKNAAGPRYIYTQLNELTPLLFRKEDECIYDFVDEDGVQAEPILYAPISCLLLINGSRGIGTGFSTLIPCYNPLDINENIKLLLKNKEPVDMLPWYKNFKGKIVMTDQHGKKYESRGILEIIDENNIIIEELPIGTWTENYSSFLETLLVDDAHGKNYEEHQILLNIVNDCGIDSIKYILTLRDGVLQDLIKKNELEKTLKLVNTHSITNLHLYDEEGKLNKYENINDILKNYYEYRLKIYEKRKKYYLKQLENEYNLLYWKKRFIELCISGELIIFDFKTKMARDEQLILKELEQKFKFPKLSNNFNALEDEKNYDYVTNIKFFDVTPQRKEKLENELEKKKVEIETYKNLSVKDIWLRELEEFEIAYKKWYSSSNIIETKKKKNTEKQTKRKKK